ncbi:MAG: ATP-binding protein [Candidatus Omnitrophota bacterium]
MNLYALPLLISAIFGYSNAIFLLLKSKTFKIKSSVIFALVWLSGATWFLGYFLMTISTQEHVALIFSRLAYVGVFFIPVFFYHFTITFLDIKNKKHIVRLIYLQIFIFLILLLKTDLIVPGIYKYYYGFHTKVGKLHPLFLLIFIVIFINCFFKFYKVLKSKKYVSAVEYNRIKYMLLAWAIATIGATDFISDYGVEYYPLGFLFVNASLFIVTYAIIRFRIMDITVATARAGILTVVYALVLGIPFGIGGIIKPWFYKDGSNWWVLPVFLMALLASAGPFVYMKIKERVEARLRMEEFKSHKELRRLSHNMLRFIKLEDLLKLIVHHLIKILKLKFAAIYLIDEVTNNYVLKSSWYLGEYAILPSEFSKDSLLVKDFNLRRLPIVTEELKLFTPEEFSSRLKELAGILSVLKINVAIPSFLRQGFFGFLVLSDKRTNLAFTQEELNLLMVLSNEAALAIENAQFHQRERSMLVEKSRREALADMAPGASHQFNNRLVAIGSSAELLLSRLEDLDIDNIKEEGVKNFLQDTKKTLEIIDKEVYKGKEITSAILKRSKARTDFQKVDIPMMAENTYKLAMISRSKPGAEKFKEPKFEIVSSNNIPPVMASEALLQDTFYNLFDNACDAIQEKAKLISSRELYTKDSLNYSGEIRIVLTQENNSLVIQIKDNGIGLKKEDQHKIFTPYFTTKASSGKGSGLGLYVIRDFIEIHKGIITCDSEYKVGTTFTVKIPIDGKRKEGF